MYAHNEPDVEAIEGPWSRSRRKSDRRRRGSLRSVGRAWPDVPSLLGVAAAQAGFDVGPTVFDVSIAECVEQRASGLTVAARQLGGALVAVATGHLSVGALGTGFDLGSQLAGAGDCGRARLAGIVLVAAADGPTVMKRMGMKRRIVNLVERGLPPIAAVSERRAISGPASVLWVASVRESRFSGDLEPSMTRMHRAWTTAASHRRCPDRDTHVMSSTGDTPMKIGRQRHADGVERAV